MIKSLFVACCLFSLVAAGQTSAAGFPDAIKTTKLATQINIPGTRVFIVPPAGFKLSSSLPALEKGETGRVQAMDLPGGNYYTNAATFTKQHFEEKGIRLLDFKTLTLNGLPAKWALIEADEQTSMYQLVFGDATFSTMIMGVFPTRDRITGDAIKQAFRSIFYDKDFVVDPLASAHFKLDETKSIFKFAKFAASIYMYSINGIKKDAYDNEPYMMALSLPAEEGSLTAVADELADMMKDTTIRNVSTNPTNGFASLKREVYGKLNGKPALLFQHVVLIKGNAIIMQGIADDQFEKYLVEFEKLTGTVREK